MTTNHYNILNIVVNTEHLGTDRNAWAYYNILNIVVNTEHLANAGLSKADYNILNIVVNKIGRASCRERV